MLKLFKNFSYTIFSNLSNTLISVLVIFIIPKVINQTDYGMFQIFLFYFSYAGLLQLGWLDGIYLRYGGIYYKDINKNIFKGQFGLYSLFQLVIATGIIIYSLVCIKGNFRNLAILIAIGVFSTNVKGFFQFVLQLTNRITSFAISNVITSVAYGLLVIVVLIIGIRNYTYFIWANIIGQIVAFIYGAYLCKDILLKKVKPEYSFDEVKENISSGIKISFASISGMLILGIVRLGVQKEWSVVTFGKVSLVLSICNLLMLFINAASLVLFPILRRIKNKDMRKIYSSVNSFFLPFLYLLLITYYPVRLIIDAWLPKYQGTLIFMAFLFPLGLYQGKFEVMSTTFFKVWRMETDLMLVNIISLIASAIFTLFFAIFLHNLSLSILSIIFTLAIRSFISDLVILRKMNINLIKSFIEENLVVAVFIISNFIFKWYTSLLTYTIFILLVIFMERDNIKSGIKTVRQIDFNAIE